MSLHRSRGARAALFTLVAAGALVALPSAAQAQRRRPTPRTAPIEIRGQVPTPQVVTVRPRETPEFSRQVLVPNFYDRQFWPVILPGYQVVSRRALSGPPALDSVSTTTPVNAPVPPASAPVDSTRRPPGTAPAR